MKSSEVSFLSGFAGLVLILVGLVLGLDVKNARCKKLQRQKGIMLCLLPYNKNEKYDIIGCRWPLI